MGFITGLARRDYCCPESLDLASPKAQQSCITEPHTPCFAFGFVAAPARLPPVP
jgi:hypothetical protein